MKKNVGTIDRVARVILALAIAILYFAGTISGTTAIVLGVLSVIFLATSFVGSCPLYSVCNISSNKQANKTQ